MRILHIADVHLDRPFVDLGAADARARRAEVRDTFRRALKVGEEREVDLITIGGDLWEHENVIADTRLSVAREPGRRTSRRGWRIWSGNGASRWGSGS
jgi:DNA repair protein SbcD/Mre11